MDSSESVVGCVAGQQRQQQQPHQFDQSRLEPKIKSKLTFSPLPTKAQTPSTFASPRSPVFLSSSLSDRACAYCRERKIRCGRQRPRCTNCTRDGIANCRYEVPGRRVNHLKLLCDSVEGLERRIEGIEAGMGRLIGMLENKDKIGTGSHKEAFVPSSLVSDEDDESLLDLYGPDTLLGHCRRFYKRVEQELGLSERTLAESGFQGNPDTAIRTHLTNMIRETEKEPIDVQPSCSPTQPPPRRLVTLAQAEFFKCRDWRTDMFLESRFNKNTECLYTRNDPDIEDEAWSACLNAVVVLVFDSREQRWQKMPSIWPSLVRSCLDSALSALNKHFLTSPTLANAQAMALLSIVAEHYCSPSVAIMAFARACGLARVFGLRRDVNSENDGHEKEQEYQKLIRALYLRDKRLEASRGSPCWLPSFELDVHAVADENSARMQLACLQEDACRISHANFRSPNKEDHRALICRLQKWADKYDAFTPKSNMSIDLLFDLLVIRLALSQRVDYKQAVSDARMCCLLLLEVRNEVCVNDLEFENMYGSSSPNHASIAIMERIGSGACQGLANHSGCNREAAPSLRNRTRVNAFPVVAFFVLAENLVVLSTRTPGSDSSRSDDPQTGRNDLDLLRCVHAYYESACTAESQNNYISQASRVFGEMLELLKIFCYQKWRPDTTAQAQMHARHYSLGSASLDSSNTDLEIGPLGADIDARGPVNADEAIETYPWSPAGMADPAMHNCKDASVTLESGGVSQIPSYANQWLFEPEVGRYPIQMDAQMAIQTAIPAPAGSKEIAGMSFGDEWGFMKEHPNLQYFTV